MDQLTRELFGQICNFNGSPIDLEQMDLKEFIGDAKNDFYLYWPKFYEKYIKDDLEKDSSFEDYVNQRKKEILDYIMHYCADYYDNVTILFFFFFVFLIFNFISPNVCH